VVYWTVNELGKESLPKPFSHNMNMFRDLYAIILVSRASQEDGLEKGLEDEYKGQKNLSTPVSLHWTVILFSSRHRSKPVMR